MVTEIVYCCHNFYRVFYFIKHFYDFTRRGVNCLLGDTSPQRVHKYRTTDQNEIEAEVYLSFESMLMLPCTARDNVILQIDSVEIASWLY